MNDQIKADLERDQDDINKVVASILRFTDAAMEVLISMPAKHAAAAAVGCSIFAATYGQLGTDEAKKEYMRQVELTIQDMCAAFKLQEQSNEG